MVVVKILVGKVIKSRTSYLRKGRGHDRGRKKLVSPQLTGFCSPYLVHRLAIYNWLRRSGLVEDSTGLGNLAVLSGPGAEVTGQETVL